MEVKEIETQQKFSKEEVLNASTEYFKGDAMAADVWLRKYALKDSEGAIYELTPEDMHRRLAKEFARIEKNYNNPISEDEIFDLIKDFKYIIPQGSPMAGIGNNFQYVSISNCFVIGNEVDCDSYGGILKLDQELVQLQKRRAGVGLDLSFVRPEGSIVLNSALTSTGVVPFMERYSNSTREVAQDGRRGALMESISIVHPDSEKFIDAKLEEGKVTGANISIKLTDEFMNAAINKTSFTQKYPIDSEIPTYTKEIDAQELWKKVIFNAWKCVPYDTEIVAYDENDKFCIKKIGEIVKEKSKFKVLSLNLQTFKVEKKEITDFQEYENSKKIFLLKTKRGKEILSTNDHIVYILKDDKLKEIPICEVKSGDFLITTNKNRFDENDFNDMIELDLKYFENFSVTFDDFDKKMNDQKIINDLGFYEKSSKASHCLKNKKISVKEFIKIKEKLGNLQNIKIVYGDAKCDVNFEIHNELMLFLGLWIAEGSYHGTELLLHINKSEIQYYEKTFDYVSDKFNIKWGCEIEENYAKITFSSSMLVNFCKSIGFDYENRNKKIPDWIYRISLNKVGWFLNGVFSGDGTVSKRGFISLTQSNKKLIEDVRNLLLMFGIQSSVGLSEKMGDKIIKGKNCNIKDSYKLSISKSGNMIFYKRISFVLKDKRDRIALDNLKDLCVIPLSKEKLNKLRLFGRKTVSKSLLINKMNEKNIDIDFKILNDDIIYEEVEFVKEQNCNIDKVYDITVKDNHTFILANGCVISNSAEPGVLFWDTIIRESISDCYSDLGFNTVSTNPCFEGNQRLLTEGGYKTFKELSELTKQKKCPKLINRYGEAVDGSVWSNGVKKVVELTVNYDKKIICTPEHKFATITNVNDSVEYSIEAKKALTYNLISFSKTKLNEKFHVYENSVNVTGVQMLEFPVEVFDFNLQDNCHWGVVEDMIVHNCGEIPLCPGDSCRLLAINLYSYVENPFTENASFNHELFKKHVFIAQRIMDDLIDLELEKIDSILRKIDSDPEPEQIKNTERNLWVQIKEKAELGRRCGLGITAEGDVLAAIGLIYGTDEATNFAVEIQKTLKLEAYRSSVNLAKERGAFEIWDAQREINNPFIQRIKDEDEYLYNEMMAYGRRNIALLTIAPTGSVSIMTQTTSGIEPVFLPSYMRRRKINPQEKDTRVDFTDKQGDCWQEYPVFHHKFETWLEVNGYDVTDVKKMNSAEVNKIVEQSPYYKATSADVDWVKKVEMQGKIQKHVDHSISVTVNLPNDATEELVAKVYETGWRVGCKGLTVYRDGCRSGVLVSSKEEKDNGVEHETHAVKRPKAVNADVLTFNNNYEKWVAVVGKLAPYDGVEEQPYELFTGKLDSFPIPSYVEKGQIVKRKIKGEDGKDVSVYDFKFVDKDGYAVEMGGLSRSFDEEYWNYAKLISAVLRHRMPIQYAVEVVKSLKLKGESLNTWKNGVVRTLKQYVKDGTKSADTCEVCGAKLIYVEGCLKCNSCGQYSKCG